MKSSIIKNLSYSIFLAMLIILPFEPAKARVQSCPADCSDNAGLLGYFAYYPPNDILQYWEFGSFGGGEAPTMANCRNNARIACDVAVSFYNDNCGVFYVNADALNGGSFTMNCRRAPLELTKSSVTAD